MTGIATPAALAAAIVPAFTPVPVRARMDGWTAARQATFIRALAATRCVGRAAWAAGMSRESAYRLRRHKGAESFAAAWDSILAARPRGVTGFDLQWHRIVRAAIKADPDARWERTFRDPDQPPVDGRSGRRIEPPVRGRSQ